MSQQYWFNEETVTDVIGREPAWIIKSGLYLVTGFVICLLCFSWFMPYPDSVSGQVVIRTSASPQLVNHQQGGKITQVLVKDNDFVYDGQPLFLVDSDMDLKQWNALLNLTNVTESQLTAQHRQNIIQVTTTDQRLGDLRAKLNAWLALLNAYAALLDSPEQQLLGARLEELKMIQEELTRAWQTRQDSLEQKNALTASLLEKAKTAASLGLVPEEKVLAMQQNLLQSKVSLEDSYTGFIANQNQYLQEKFSLEMKIAENTMSRKKLQQEIDSVRIALQDELHTWHSRHVITAITDGRINFTRSWKEGHVITPEQVVYSLAPEAQGRESTMLISSARALVLKESMRVLIEPDGYDPHVTGKLSATIAAINPIPVDGIYQLSLSLPEPLVTTTGVDLSSAVHISGNGKAITESKRLIERLFGMLFPKQIN